MALLELTLPASVMQSNAQNNIGLYYLKQYEHNSTFRAKARFRFRRKVKVRPNR